MPKVIDFGIAKAIGQQLTDKTVFTAFEQFIGTPAYMSPEQAVMTSLDIDTRSDIYALGVLLYELLTGHTPFDQKELVAAGLDEMRRIIREQEPARPSTRLSTLADPEQTTVAQRRHSEPPQLIHLVRGDLDWIVMKCLEKDRARRYETANGLADDVLRHLEDEPVLARPPGRVYRLQKLVRRNKLVFGAGTAVVVALVLGLGFSLWSLSKERRTRLRAVAAENRAQAAAGKSEQVAQFLKDMLKGVGPSVAMGRDTTMLKEILDKTAERVGKDLKDQPEIEAELRSTLGEVYFALSLYTNAETMHRAALTIRKGLWGNLNTNVADSLDGLGRAIQWQGWIADRAEPFFQEALSIRTNLLGTEHPAIAASLFNLGYVRMWQGRYPEAERFFRQSLAMRRKLLGNDSVEVAQALSALSCVLYIQEQVVEAENAAREALAIRARISADEPNWDSEITQARLGIALFLQHKLDEAEVVLRQAVSSYRKVLGTDHRDIVDALRILARVLLEKGQLADAETQAQEAVRMSKRLFGARNPNTAVCMGVLGSIFRKAGKLGEAEDAFREELAVWEELAIAPGNKALARSMLIEVLRERGKLAEAEAVYRKAIEAGRKSNDPHAVVGALASLGDMLRDQGKVAQADPVYREGLDICRHAATNDPEQRQWLAAGLAGLLRSQGKLAEAEPFYREALTNAAKVWPSNPARWQWQVNDLADVLQRQGKSAEADPMLAAMLKPGAQSASERIAPLRTQIDLSGRRGQWKEATADLSKLLELDPSGVHEHLQLAVLLVETGDLEAYRAHCRKMLSRFSGTNDDAGTLDQTAKACLLVPGSVLGPESASQLVDKAVTLGKDNAWFSYLQMDKGLAEYRRGQYASAVDWMRKVIGQPMSVGRSLPAWQRDTAAYSVLAMAQHQLKQTDEARAALAQALELAQTKLPQVGHDNLEQDWVDWLIAHILLREAKALVNGELKTSTQ